MERGWGLTFDNSDQVGFFGNKPVFGSLNLSPRLDHRSNGLIMFPVNSRGKEEQSQAQNRELDFFADNKRPIDVKKENSHAEPSTRRDFDVNVSNFICIHTLNFISCLRYLFV